MADGETVDALRPEFRAILQALEASGAIAKPDEIAAYERRQRIELRREALASSGLHLPDEDRRMILAGSFDRTKPACAAVLEWARGAPKRGQKPDGCTPGVLVMCGAPGTGKSLAGGWWLSHVRGRAVTIQEAIRLYTLWKRTTYRPENAEAALETLARMDNLLLDELGQESDSDAEVAREVLHWIVDRRQSKSLRTLVLTNLSARDLGERFAKGVYDGRTADRLRAHGRVVQVAGSSMRRSAT